MNCRRVNSLLSAFVDAEVTGEEMLAIRAHLNGCASCSAEYQSLRETKQLLASLALKTPRAELENLLMREAERSSRTEGLLERWLPIWSFHISEWASSSESLRPSGSQTPWLRPRPLAATAILSLAGLWLASASVDNPTEIAVGSSVPMYHPLATSILRVQTGGTAMTMLPSSLPGLPSRSLTATSIRAGIMGIPLPPMSAPSPMGTRIYGGAVTVTPAAFSVDEQNVSPVIYNSTSSGGAVVLLSVARDMTAQR